jgi:hypothetical protein
MFKNTQLFLEEYSHSSFQLNSGSEFEPFLVEEIRSL